LDPVGFSFLQMTGTSAVVCAGEWGFTTQPLTIKHRTKTTDTFIIQSSKRYLDNHRSIANSRGAQLAELESKVQPN
jgi:hypothetical protein